MPCINHLLCRQRAEARNLKTFVLKQVAYAGREPPTPKGSKENDEDCQEANSRHVYNRRTDCDARDDAMKRLAGIIKRKMKSAK